MPTTTTLRFATRAPQLLSQTRRTFTSSAPRHAEASPILPARRPVGAFRGGLFGFLAGAVGAGGSMYYYVVEEYRASNELLTEDIYNLSATVRRVEAYVRSLEEKVDGVARKR